MQQPNGFLQVVGEMVSIVVLALTGRFIGFAQSTLESGVPLTMERALSHFTDILSVFTRFGNAGLLLSVLIGASLIRIGIAYANRSVLLGLRDMAGIATDDLSWGQRTVRLPIAVVYRSLAASPRSWARLLWRSAFGSSTRRIHLALPSSAPTCSR